MWTNNRTGIALEKKDKDKTKHEAVTFPPISNGPVKSLPQGQNDHGPHNRTKKKKISRCQVAPYARVSVEIDLKVTAHLKYHLQQRYLKTSSYFLSPEKKKDDDLTLLTTKTLLLKDEALKTSFKDSRTAGSSDTDPQYLPSLIMEKTLDKEDFPALLYCADKTAYPGSSQGAHEGGQLEKRDHSLSMQPDEKKQYIQDCIKTNSQQWETERLCHVKRRIMIYLCGGYKDTVAERIALMESVYPQLYLYCKQRGYDFRMIDLRRGVEDPITDHHDSVALHLEMLKKCQETVGPNFFLITGQKHELQSLPTTISQKHFEAILKTVIRDRERVSKRQSDLEEIHIETQSSTAKSSANSFIPGSEEPETEWNAGSTALLSESTHSYGEDGEEACLARNWADVDRDLTLLLTWYQLDENTVPPVYRLLPVSAHHPDFLSRDGARRKAARKAWHYSCQQMCRVLQRYGPVAIGEKEMLCLLRTVLDWEVEQGLGTKHPAEEYGHCYKRTITDLLYNLKSEYASQFVDMQKGRAELNHTLYETQQKFIHNIHRKLRHTNIYEANVCWGRKGLSPEDNRSHQFYTERLCSHFLTTVIAAFNRVMHVRPIKSSLGIMRQEALQTQIQEEIQLHLQHGKTLAQSFELRHNFLLEVRDALQNSASFQNALLLLGEPGLGKSTTLARVTKLLPTWIPGDVTVLVCFVGLTSDSRNVRLLLQKLCIQIAGIYCKNTEISESLAQLCKELHSLLTLVNEKNPLALVLDGLDELSEEHGADLSWLYTPLPCHVYTILSANTQSTVAHLLQTQAKVSVLTIPSLSSDEIKASLSSKLASDSRQLQEDQWTLLLHSCIYCPFPMYLRFAYRESKYWTSSSLPEQCSLPGDFRSLFLILLSRLEREYGENLVRRAMSLISLSHGGVTEEELLNLLGHDSQVAQELIQLHNQTATTSGYPDVPYGILARLRWELRYHIMEVENNGTWVLCWNHNEFSNVISQRYLKTEESKKAIHVDIADYFSCSASDSQVFQPLAWIREEDGKKSYVFNFRKLHGLPYHLIHSGQIVSLLSQCLFNYEFLLHKVWGLSISHVEEDLKAAVILNKTVPDINVLAQALCLSRPVLLKDPCQLASQLLGRLLHIAAQDKPVAPGDPQHFSYLHDLLTQCQLSSLPVLVPSYSCLLPPGGITHTLLAGHLSPVKALALGKYHAISCSVDGTLNLWKMEGSVTLVKSIPSAVGSGLNFAPEALALCQEDTVLVLTIGHRLQVQEVHSRKVLYTDSVSVDAPIITSTCDGQMLVVFYDGSHIVKVFDLSASCSLLHCVNVTLDCECIYKDNTILVSHTSVKDYVLFGYRNGGEAAVFSARAGSVLATLKAQHQAASLQAVQMNSQYILLCCRYPLPLKRSSDIIHIELFSTGSFQYLRSIIGCSQDYISHITINKGGTNIVAFCPSTYNRTTEIISWNIETEDHKHLAQFPGLLTAGICSDLRFCLGFCNGERYLRLWNLASRINDQSLTYNIQSVQSEGIGEIIAMDKYPSYVVCRSTCPGTVRVWNVCRARFKARPVLVEYSLFTSDDVVFVRDLKLYILTDHGTATLTDTPTPVYQTLLVYDLLTRTYIRKQSGLFIVPCPEQDYRLLEGELLLGLSETRDHLIIWDLICGYIKGRIKTKHKDPLLSSSLADDSQPLNITSLERSGTSKQSARKTREENEFQRMKEVQQCLEREKYNSIDQYLLSGDEKVVICSYFAHHLNVFSVVSREHLHTLEDCCSLLDLRTAALTHSGRYLVISNYSEAQRSPYLTLWDTQHGRVQKRLKNEPDICCVAITDDASRIAFGVGKRNKLKVWEPFLRKHKTILGYGNLQISVSSRLYITEGGSKAVLLADQVSVWDLDAGTVLSVFTPDSRIQCLSVVGKENCTLLLGFSDISTLISMTLSKQCVTTTSKITAHDQLFGESSSSEDEEN